MFFYNIGVRLYAFVLWCAAPFHPKAKKWLKGRVGWRDKIASFKGKQNLIWFHAASTGEMEMALPIIQEWKARHKNDFVFLSIYSPSAEFFVHKNNPIDAWCYLPIDTQAHAEYWVKTLKPKAAVFIKYDFWIHFLKALHKHQIPSFFSGSIFRSNQIFFKSYGAFYARALRLISQIWVQDSKSIELLKSIGYTRTQIVGDTRFDRVLELSQSSFSDAIIESFLQQKPCILVGSSWAADEKHYLPLIDKYTQFKWIIAPHELHEDNMTRLMTQLNTRVSRYTQYALSDAENRVLILDTMGMLSKVYRYAQIALVGGGFGPGVHSLLEPAVYGIPVFFGPNHYAFKEAQELIDMGVGFCYRNTSECELYLQRLIVENADIQIKNRLNTYFQSKAQVHTKVVGLIEQNIANQLNNGF